MGNFLDMLLSVGLVVIAIIALILLFCLFIFILSSPLIAIGLGASFIVWITCLPLTIC